MAELVTLLGNDEVRRDELSELVRVGVDSISSAILRSDSLFASASSSTSSERFSAPARAVARGAPRGEEAWTLAMLLAEAARGRPFRVVGLDCSQAALAAAESASYSTESAREVTERARSIATSRERATGRCGSSLGCASG